MWQTLRQDAAVCGGGASGRIWLRDTHPVTDAILTLAKLLQWLSQDDAPLSQRR
jgi:phosphomannomutase